MRPLRPGALPSDTSLRFALVLAAVVAASLYLFQAMWFLIRGRTFLDVVVACMDRAGTDQVVTSEALDALLGRGEACRADVSREQAGAVLLGVLAVLVVAWALYRTWPGWRERRRHLVALDDPESALLRAAVEGLADAAGVRPVPLLRVAATDPAVAGFAYGAGRRMRLGLSGGLVVTQVLDPPAFDAVVRHELGHVADRDVRWTGYAICAWWSFVVVALSPVVVSFATRDAAYLLRLGWRTVALALLVGMSITALLRTRELYADARAHEWGSGPALDRLLATGDRPVRARPGWRRPGALRLHPRPDQRRALLADPDGLFSASGWVALGAGIATGTAFASLADLAYLVLPTTASFTVAALLVAPLLAAVLCLVAWRVALVEVVRDGSRPAAAPLGVGAGVGLAVAPLLSIEAAVGGVASDAAGWAGYGVWAAAMVGVGVLLAQWVTATARLGVTAAVRSRGGAVGNVLAHVAATSVMVVVWLAAGAQALLLLAALGPGAAMEVPVWALLPALVLGGGAVGAPLVLLALLLGPPILAWRRLRSGSPMAGWFWRDRGPTLPGDLPAEPEAARTVPSPSPVVLPGLGAGVIAGLLPLGVLLAGEVLDPRVRQSDALAVALGRAVESGMLVAGAVAGVVAVGLLPRRWWPLALGSTLVALAVAVAIAWVVLSANRMGMLAHRPGPTGLLGPTGVRELLLRPAGRAVVPCALLVAGLGGLRAARTGPPAVPAPTPVPAPGAPGPLPGRPPGQAGRRRPAVRLLLPALLCAALVAPVVATVPWLTVPLLSVPGVEVVLPAQWRGTADPRGGTLVMTTVAQDVQVAIMPIAAPAPRAAGGTLVVGGISAPVVGGRDRGPERVLAFDAATPAGPRRILVIGTPEALARREVELQRLLDSVRWVPLA